MPGVKQPCPTVAACWSPAMPRMRIGPPNRCGTVVPKSAAQSRTSGSSAAGTRNRSSSSSSHCAACGYRAAACAPHWWRRSHAPCRRSAARAGRCRPCRRRAGRPPPPRARRHVVEQPGDLGRGEIRIEQQAGRARSRASRGRRARSAAQASCGAAVLPDDGVVDRLAGRAVPDHRGLALVGDADRRDVLRAATPACAIAPRAVATDAWSRSPPGRARPSRAPDRSAGIPAARCATGASVASNTMRARRGRALVDREQIGRHSAPFYAFVRHARRAARSP